MEILTTYIVQTNYCLFLNEALVAAKSTWLQNNCQSYSIYGLALNSKKYFSLTEIDWLIGSVIPSISKFTSEIAFKSCSLVTKLGLHLNNFVKQLVNNYTTDLVKLIKPIAQKQNPSLLLHPTLSQLQISLWNWSVLKVTTRIIIRAYKESREFILSPVLHDHFF